ncbi:hypothetical protein PIB30_045543 [Stylosanthes scabra]|uniref:C-JID domain-containing protein n=1 Tax=Stylosanthes scabra TaxID=79078 RepID=A0ABU6UEU5_9FABA|nr:hypothetical protein [Stylosanthes scabra]
MVSTHGIVLRDYSDEENTDDLDEENPSDEPDEENTDHSDEENTLDRRDLSFSNMCRLKFLLLDCIKTAFLCNIPYTLKVFGWRYCPMKTLPSADHQRYELVEIDLTRSKIVQLWNGKKFLNKLEHLNLSDCHKLKETPDLSGAPNLKTLDLQRCYKLKTIHPSITHHKKLVELKITNCWSLETLGDKWEMSSLKKLNILEDYFRWCKIFRLPEFGECMKQLSILTVKLGNIMELPSTFGNLVGLTELYLDLGHIGLPKPLGCFLCLKKLSLRQADPDLIISDFPLYHCCSCYCRELEVLPELPSSLRVLDASGCYSLDASDVNDVISKACCGFAESASQDGEDVFEMVIPGKGKDIPAWFEHQEQGNGVSLSFSHNCPSTQTMALSLCFVFDDPNYKMEPSVICCIGKEFINKSLLKVLPWMYSGDMAIVFLNGYYVSNLLGQHNRFHILFPNHTDYNINTPVTRSAARWVCYQGIQDFKKRKAALELRE